MHTATRRTLLSGATAAQPWYDWLNANFTVLGAYDFRGVSTAAEATKYGSLTLKVGTPVFDADGLDCSSDTVFSANELISPGYTWGALVSDVVVSSAHAMGAHWSSDIAYDYYVAPWNTGTGATWRHGPGIYLGSGTYLTEGLIGCAGNGAMRNGVKVSTMTAASFDSKADCGIGGSSRGSSAFHENPFTGTLRAAFLVSDTLSEVEWAELYERILVG